MVTSKNYSLICLWQFNIVFFTAYTPIHPSGSYSTDENRSPAVIHDCVPRRAALSSPTRLFYALFMSYTIFQTLISTDLCSLIIHHMNLLQDNSSGCSSILRQGRQCRIVFWFQVENRLIMWKYDNRLRCRDQSSAGFIMFAFDWLFLLFLPGGAALL